MNDQGLFLGWGIGVFIFITTSRTVLGPVLTSVHWVGNGDSYWGFVTCSHITAIENGLELPLSHILFLYYGQDESIYFFFSIIHMNFTPQLCYMKLS